MENITSQVDIMDMFFNIFKKSANLLITVKYKKANINLFWN